MRIRTTSIWPGVNLVLVEEDGQWQFLYWSALLGDLLPEPSSADRERRFDNYDAACDHFRSICQPKTWQA